MIKLTTLAILLVAATYVAADDHIRFKDCANGEIISLKFSGCTSTDRFCKVHKNKDQKFIAVFKANQDTATVKLEMIANIGGVQIAVPGLKTNACAGDITCPLKKGQNYTYTYTLNLPSVYPDVSAEVILKLIGDNGHVLACANMAGKVVEN